MGMPQKLQRSEHCDDNTQTQLSEGLISHMTRLLQITMQLHALGKLLVFIAALDLTTYANALPCAQVRFPSQVPL